MAQDLSTFRRLRESFVPVLSPDEFWERKAFTNFVPELVEPLPSRPTARQWDAGRSEFEALLDYVRPKRILVVGATLWRHLPPAEHETKSTRIYRGHILAAWILHPSSWNRQRYTLADARRVTSRLMAHNP